MAKQRRQSKAAGRVLRALKLLRGAENVPDSSFEARQKQLVGPREDPWQSSEWPSKAAKCQIAVSKPNRNSSWRLGSVR